ncbi:MAG: LysM peptidoglycan-binding domain-containing protein, partial [Chloroflexi bacterium]|nr:LysM peptidoglycan-binding domain-containing protein [Chloroflexota bacterium]
MVRFGIVGILIVAAITLAACGTSREEAPAPADPIPQATLPPLSVEVVGENAPPEPVSDLAAQPLDEPQAAESEAPLASDPIPASALPAPEIVYPPPMPTIAANSVPAAIDYTRPVADAEVVAAALDQPVAGRTGANTVPRQVDPLTVLPLRSRGEVVLYTVRWGDSLRSIADQFGLEENTLIWSNDPFYVNAMAVGMELNILPVDGVYHQSAQPATIADIAAEYDVEPYAIIDSEYNELFGATPQTILPAGMAVVVPGGTGSQQPVYWDPGIVITTDGSNPVGSGVNVGGQIASFAVGDPGSCGEQTVVGGSPPNQFLPIQERYTITQDFTWNHGGIDLA